jgi:uncharacterized protein YcnI
MSWMFPRAAAALGILIASSGPALAHIGLEIGEAPVGSSYKAVLGVPHGCSGAATTQISVQIPEGFLGVKPMPKAGWTIELVTGPYARSYELFGSPITEGVTQVTWSGGELPDGYYDEFVLHGTFAASLDAGSTVFFPVVQTCGTAEEAWIDISGDENAETPAPSLTLLPADGGH